MRRYLWLAFAVATVALAAWMLRWDHFTRHRHDMGAEIIRVNRLTGEVQEYYGEEWVPR